jgi:hypothetical protein
MDENREHHLKRSQPGSDCKNHMFSFICGLKTQSKCSNNVGYGSHIKGKTHTGEIGKGKKT